MRHGSGTMGETNRGTRFQTRSFDKQFHKDIDAFVFWHQTQSMGIEPAARLMTGSGVLALKAGMSTLNANLNNEP